MIRANDDEIFWLFYIKKARYVPKERSDQLLILYLRPAFFSPFPLFQIASFHRNAVAFNTMVTPLSEAMKIKPKCTVSVPVKSLELIN
jgi:hypothetical protein